MTYGYAHLHPRLVVGHDGLHDAVVERSLVGQPIFAHIALNSLLSSNCVCLGLPFWLSAFEKQAHHDDSRLVSLGSAVMIGMTGLILFIKKH